MKLLCILKTIVEEKPLNEGFFDKIKQSIKSVGGGKKVMFKMTPDTWAHATRSKELVDLLLSGKDFVGEKEDLIKFNVPIVGPFAKYDNKDSPNFVKGRLFHGYDKHPYLITTELPDEAFQPNWNSRNYDDLDKSSNVAVLKPEYRDAKNFKLWNRNQDGVYELIK